LVLYGYSKRRIFMRKVKIFLASSAKLKEFRDELDRRVSAKNKIWSDKGIILELVIWEDLESHMQLSRSQDAYNREIKKCEYFVLIASKSLGKYSKEEFDVAYELFLNNVKPKILTFIEDTKEKDESLNNFINFCQEKDHFPVYYETFDDIWNEFNKNIEEYLHKLYDRLSDTEKHETFSKCIGVDSPIKPAVFIGREGFLAEIYKAFFEDGKRVVMITGNGGLGKTTVASRYYYNFQDEYSHLIWTINKKDIEDTILSLSIELGLKDDGRVDKKTFLNKIIQKIDSLKKPLLFVIDNVDDYDDLMSNHQVLKKINNTHLLLTSRVQNFDEFEKLQVSKLKPEKAKELFLKYFTSYKESDKELLGSVLEAIGYNTLSIEVFAKNLQKQVKRGYSLEKFVYEIQTQNVLSISKQSTISHNHNILQPAKPTQIIKAMYNISKLGKDDLALLSLFSLLPEIAIGYDDIEVFSPIKKENLGDILENLENGAWLSYDEDDMGYKINAIVAHIIREEQKDRLYQMSEPLIDKTMEVLDYDANTGFIEDYNLASKYVKYIESFLTFIKERNFTISLVYDRLANYYEVYGLTSKALEYYEKYLKLKEELYNQDRNNTSLKNGLAISYSKWSIMKKK